MSDDLRQVRLDKREALREQGIPVHPERYERSHTLAEAAALPEGATGLRLAGRVVAVRSFGKLTFAHLQDLDARLQIALEKSRLDAAAWSRFHEHVDVGDFVGVEGELFVTRKGELTLRVEAWTFLGKALRPLPGKWHGLKDAEIRQRRRYLDLVMGEDTRRRFRLRTRVVRTLRRFLDDEGFEEVETPVLQTVASGAAARPFVTHHNALDLDVSLRIAPETWLKRLVVGGYDRVYEFARCFRNEGMDPSHLQEFTMLEYYCAYWSWEDNLRFTERLVRHVVREVLGSERVEWRGRTLDFGGEWPRLDLGGLVRDKTGIDIDALPDVANLRTAIRDAGIELDGMDAMGRGNVVDALYKRTVRDDLVQPCFLVGIPADTLPLARRNDADPRRADCFQLLVNGWEIIKAYSELVDPVEQRRLFEEQERLRRGGDEEAMPLDEEYLLAMEYGMPPISGWGMGIERLCALLGGADSLREVTLFPLLRPLPAGTSDALDEAEAEAAAQAGEERPASAGVAAPTDAPAPAPGPSDPWPNPAGPDGSADVPEFPLTRDQARALFERHVTSDYLTRHCLASAAVLEAVADRFGKNRDAYWCIGLLHDLDFDRIKEPDRHTRETVRLLREAGVEDESVLKAILAHNAEGLGDVERDRWLDWALSCSETVTGLVLAAAKVTPEKTLASLKPKSVLKRFKKKDFARQVDRDLIRQCERIGLELEDFLRLALGAMQAHADELDG